MWLGWAYCSTGSMGSTQENAVTTIPALYAQLCDSFETVDLEHGFLARCAIPLGSLWMEDEIGHTAFGTSHAAMSECHSGLPGGRGASGLGEESHPHFLAGQPLL